MQQPLIQKQQARRLASRRKIKQSIPLTLSYVLLTAYAILCLYPFLWMVSSALKSNQEIVSNPSLLPRQWHWETIVHVWNDLNFWQYFTNSMIVTVLTIIGIVLVYSLAGYGFAKTSFWGRDLFFLAFVALLLVPGVTVLVPLAQLVRAFGLIGRESTQTSVYMAVIFPVINGAGPLAIFLFRNFFAGLPDELRDAARVDGCSEFGIYMRIFLPLALPVIATVSIMNFITTWNAYIWPSIVINNDDWFTLPLKLKDLDLQTVVQWNVRMAGSLITTLPIILVFLLLQRYYVKGLTSGALKG
ncbi:carbohydrate ABC transporter permease [Tengunoibacter tsumagoiensis]|uniref:ABC transporter permease n=1 Tax=Tengunoibacter tsumagoiensis TaxID=2014871 RepID=A0A402A4F4_9CHLR|nr:carbohydrate ABC transporter permease [Tengunoibacter tsumagoiensis]GCE14023.1 ABC transporter permease [Tengunoibacter tsumagoiensis]